MSSYYKTIIHSGESLFKEKGSKFYGYSYAIEDEEQVKQKLSDLKQEHPKARHICFGYRLGFDGELERSSDDGEPSGTAGKPILGQIIKEDLTFVIVAVVRYFGGTLLGTGGLIKAYRQAALLAIENSEIVKKPILDIITIKGDYTTYNDFEAAISELGLDIKERNLENNFTIQLAIPESKVEISLLQLVSKVTGLYPEEIDLTSSDFDFTIEVNRSKS